MHNRIFATNKNKDTIFNQNGLFTQFDTTQIITLAVPVRGPKNIVIGEPDSGCWSRLLRLHFCSALSADGVYPTCQISLGLIEP